MQGLSKRTRSAGTKVQGYISIEALLERRGGSKTVKIGGRTYQARKYHLTKDQLEVKLEAWRKTGKFVSPYVKSILSDFLNALSNLGVNQVHLRSTVKDEMMRLMSVDTGDKLTTRVKDGVSDWKRFDTKQAHGKGSWTLMRRLEATARSLRKTDRVNSLFPIGRKLEQMGCCVDIFLLQTQLLFRLNTHSTVGLCMPIFHISQIPAVNLKARTLGPE